MSEEENDRLVWLLLQVSFALNSKMHIRDSQDVSMPEMLKLYIILKVGGFLNAEFAEKQFHGIPIVVSLILCALNVKMRIRGSVVFHKI